MFKWSGNMLAALVTMQCNHYRRIKQAPESEVTNACTD